MAHIIKLARGWRSERRSRRWRRRAKTGCLGPVFWRQAEQRKLLQLWLLVGKGGFPCCGDCSRWREKGRRPMVVAAGAPRQPLEAAAAAHKKEREKRGKEKEEAGGVILCEWRREYSQHNPNPSFYIIYLFIYLFIYLDSSSCEAQLRTHLRMLTHFNKTNYFDSNLFI